MNSTAAPDTGGVRPDRRQRRRDRNRLAILDAVEPVFQRAGFHAARIEEIADAADVSVGTLYSYFPGKQGVYLALIDRATDLFEQYMARSEHPDFTPLQRVLAGGDAYLQFHLDHPGYFHFFAQGLPVAAETDGADNEHIERICARVNNLLNRFASQIDQAVDAGEAVPINSYALARYTWGAWNGVISLARQPPTLRITDEQIVEALELGRWILLQALAGSAARADNGSITLAMPHIGPASPTSEIQNYALDRLS